MEGNEIAVLGGGESGTGAAVLAKTRGLKVFLSDNGFIKDKYKDVLSKFEIEFEEAKHSAARILKAGEVIISPGIPFSHPVVADLLKKGVPVISEIEFAGRYNKAKTVCITGSNGKTTTTLLTYHILKKAGLNAGVAGNVGESFAMSVALHDFDVYVLEISSFQLDGMHEFKADIAVLLNITPDHLDRYEHNFMKYADSKFRIIRNQDENDFFIYNEDDRTLMEAIATKVIKSKNLPFSLSPVIKEEGAYLIGNEIFINIKSQKLMITIENLALQGKHNVYNSMAAGVAARVLDIRKEIIKDSLSDFQNIEHRLEHVAMIHGIEFINDSKATNINSTWYALESMNKPVIWIAGGIDKGNDYDNLKELVKEKVKAIVCLGLDNRKIHEAFGEVIPVITDTNTARDAVNAAYEIGRQGDVVLLSPACASFDLFKNYEERGQLFKQAVHDL